METIESILRDTTAAYIRENVIRGRTDLAIIESDLMAMITAACMSHNSMCRYSGRPRITVPKRLDFQQTAQILCAAIHVRMIRAPGAKKPELMIWDGRIYKPDPRAVRLAALVLNGRLSKTELNKVVERMELLAEPAEPYSGDVFVAYENGILATKTGPYSPFEGHMLYVTEGRLYPFTPELIFLSVRPEQWEPEKASGKEE